MLTLSVPVEFHPLGGPPPAVKLNLSPLVSLVAIESPMPNPFAIDKQSFLARFETDTNLPGRVKKVDLAIVSNYQPLVLTELQS